MRPPARVAVWRRGRLLLSLAGTSLAVGACQVADAAPNVRERYATVHDTMPDSVHDAMHRLRESTDGDRSIGRGVRVGGSTLTRIAGTRDAWLDFRVERVAGVRHDAATDTITLIMNCNADSLSTQMANGRPWGQHIVVRPGSAVDFGPNKAMRVRIYGLRTLLPGRPTETLIRMALGGDLLLRTQVAAP